MADLSARIQNTADDYYLGFRSLASMFGQQQFPLRSTVVLAALCAEVQFKSLIARRGGSPPREHKLSSLYGFLDSETQDRILDCWKEKSVSIAGVGTLDQALDQLDKVFIDWRYIYEKQGGDIFLSFGSLRCLIDSLRAVA